MNNDVLSPFLTRLDSLSLEKALDQLIQSLLSIEHNQAQLKFKVEKGSIINFETGHKRYQYSPHKVQKIGKRNIVIIGESLARGYGLGDGHSISDFFCRNSQKQNVIDLSKSAMPMNSILGAASIIKKIKPEFLIIAVGNNIPTLPIANAHTFNHFIKNGIDLKKKLKEAYLKLYFTPLIKKFLELSQMPSSKMLFIIPATNEKGWQPDEDWNFPKNPDKVIPGLGNYYREQFRLCLEKFGVPFLSLGEHVQDGDFIDYCHLSFAGMDKLKGALKDRLGDRIEFSPKQNCAPRDSTLDQESATLLRLLHKKSVNPSLLNLFEDIKAIFDGKPLFCNPAYSRLVEKSHLREILSEVDPKKKRPCILENLQPLQKFDLLSPTIHTNLPLRAWDPMPVGVYQRVRQANTVFKFNSVSNKKLILKARFLKKKECSNIIVKLNDNVISNDLSDNAEIPVQILSGVNSLELKVEDTFSFPSHRELLASPKHALSKLFFTLHKFELTELKG